MLSHSTEKSFNKLPPKYNLFYLGLGPLYPAFNFVLITTFRSRNQFDPRCAYTSLPRRLVAAVAGTAAVAAGKEKVPSPHCRPVGPLSPDKCIILYSAPPTAAIKSPLLVVSLGFAEFPPGECNYMAAAISYLPVLAPRTENAEPLVTRNVHEEDTHTTGAVALGLRCW